MATIDNLSIQVTASAESAANALDRLASSAGRLRGAVQGASNGLKDTANSAKEAGTETSKAGTQAEKLGSIFQVLGNISKNGASNIATFWHSITGAVGAISRVTGVSGFAQDALGMLGKSFAGIGHAISKYGIMGLPKFFGDELVSSIKKPIAAIGNFVAGIKRIAYYRLIRTIIKEVTKAITEGMKNLYAWSKTADNTFRKTMDNMAASTQYLGNSFAAMVSPLMNALSPAIDFIVDKFVDLFNFINQVIARLSGQTSYTAAKKVAAQWDDASKKSAKSAKDASDEIKRTILGFDEINKLDGKTNSGSGGRTGSGSGKDASSMFEKRTIDGGVSSFADQLKAAFDASNWQELGTLLGGKVNDLVNGIDFAGAGKKVGQAINAWFSTKYWTLDTINFTNIGSKIAEFLNNMIGQIDFNILGRLMVQKFTIVFDMVIGFIETFDWGQAGEKLSNFATGIFQELSKWLQKTDWVKLGESIVNGIVAFFGSYDYTGLAKSASEFLGSALGAAVGLITGLGKAIGEKIGEAFNGIGQFFNEQIESCGGDIVGGILRGIIVGLTNIGVWIVENIFQPFINGFKAAFGIASPAKTMEEPGKNIVLGVFQGIINALKNIGTWVKKNIFEPIWKAIKNAGTTVINVGVSLVKKGWTTLTKFVGEIGSKAFSLAKKGWITLTAWVGDIGTKLVSLGKNGWITLTAWVGDIGTKLVSLGKNGWITLTAWVGDIGTKLVSLGKNGWTTLTAWVGNINAKSVELAKKGWTTLSAWVGEIGTKYVDVVVKIAGKIWDGVTKFWDWLWNPTDANGNVSSEKMARALIQVDPIAGSGFDASNPTSWQLTTTKNMTDTATVTANAVPGTGLSRKQAYGDGALELTPIPESSTDVNVDAKPTWASVINGILGFLNLMNLSSTITVDVKVPWSIGWFNGFLRYIGAQDQTTILSVKADTPWSTWWSNGFLQYIGAYNLSTTVTVNLERGNWYWGLQDWIGRSVSVRVDLYGGGGVVKRHEDKNVSIGFAEGGIITSHWWSKLPKMAEGGSRPHGTLFVAGEAGPEIVGHVGGRTEVLNRSQLAQTMFSAVRSAMSGVRVEGAIYNGADTESDYETMYSAMYNAFTDAMAGSNERDREKVALMRQIAAKEFTAEVTAASVNRAQTRMNRRAGTTIVPVGT